MKTPNAMHTTGSARSGFTVLELLVATAITAVLAAMLIGITTGVMAVWNRSRGSLTTSNQVKFALDQLAQDLEGAIMRHDGNVWLAATILESNFPDQNANLVNHGWLLSGSGPTPIKPDSMTAAPGGSLSLDSISLERCRFGRAGVWLRFVSNRAGSNSETDTLSAPTVVSYQMVRRRVSTRPNAEVLYMLYRAEVRPTATGMNLGSFQVGFDVIEPAYSTAGGSGNAPGTVTQPTRDQLLANNVIDFGVRLYVRENGGLRLIFPARPAALGASPATGEPSDSSITVPPAELSHLARATVSVVPTDAYRNRMPDVVEVMLRVLTDEGAQLIQALEAGQSSGDWWTIAEAHSRVYTRRIEILGKPL